jgi:radical SAM protein with 4Fe4S-binding SPASM domain
MLKKAYLEITNVCNLDCSFCPGTKREKRFMSYEDFKALAVKLRAHTDYIYFHLMGEPLLHPELGRFLDYAGQLAFKVIITTNGTLLHERGELLLDSPAVHKVNISLQSFEANRRGQLREYISGCADFAAIAGERGKLCVLRLWNQNGLDSLNGQIEEQLAEHFPKPWTESRSSRKLADRVFLEPGERFDWPDSGRDELGQSCFCYGLRDQIGVLCDGTVVPCCLDHDGEIKLGNLLEQELDNIMSTDRAKAIYNGFSARQAVEPLCRRCGYARRFG